MAAPWGLWYPVVRVARQRIQRVGGTVVDLVTQFMALFVGNSRSFGRYHPDRDGSRAHSTLKAAYEYEHFKLHMQGKTGIGIVPILDDGTVRFAAIDIDAHGETDRAIDVLALEQRVREQRLPLVVCRSKGKGAHLYAFFSEPVPAQGARSALQRWAADLGHAGCEIFPKQTSLPPPRNPDDERPLGQWINLPYFNGMTRPCIEGGVEVAPDVFIEIARGKMMTAEQFHQYMAQDHAEAPPCIQRMIAEGVRAGENKRNNALYNAVVYFKRAFPDNYRQRVRDFNATIFSRPLEQNEVDTTIRSGARKDYSYKCSEEPCVSLCDRKTCLTRRHGISIHDGTEDTLPEVEFSALMKWDSQPVRWQICANGIPLMFTTGELHAFPQVRSRVFETLHVWIKSLPAAKWETQLTKLAENLEIIETPEDVSNHGLIRAKLFQYLDTAGPDDGQDRRAEFAARSKPSPCWITYAGTEADPGRYIIFDFSDFREHLSRNRADLFKSGIELHAVLKMHCGARNMRLKFPTGPRNVQAIPATMLRRYAGGAALPASDL